MIEDSEDEDDADGGPPLPAAGVSTVDSDHQAMDISSSSSKALQHSGLPSTGSTGELKYLICNCFMARVTNRE